MAQGSRLFIQPSACRLPPSATIGMTLVELLLALTFFSILLASVSALVRSSLQVQARWGERMGPSEQMERALNRLEQDLESAQPFFGIPTVGEETRLELARLDTLPGESAPSAPAWVRVVYRMETLEGSPTLIRELFPWSEQAGQGEPRQREILLRLGSGQLAFGALDPQKQLVWASTWDGTKHGLPRLVRFTCTLVAVSAQAPLGISRIIRNPAGTLPTLEMP